MLLNESDQQYMQRALRWFVVSFFMFVLLGSASARPFSKFVTFGDSLLDTGNFYAASGETFPSSPYFEGRASNGLIWIEYVADELDLGLEPEDQFAFLGSETGDGNFNNDLPNNVAFPGYQQQIEAFLGSVEPGGVDRKAIYTVWIGANDIFTFLENGDTDTNTLIRNGVVNTVGSLSDLAEVGARNFVVVNLPDLGKIPFGREFGDEVGSRISNLVVAYNNALEQGLALFESEYQVQLVRVDAYTFFNHVIEDGELLGFENTIDQAILGYPNDDPDTYLFWDSAHPTTAGYQAFADFAVDAIIDGFRKKWKRGKKKRLFTLMSH